MKFFLFILICAGVGGECMPPIEMQKISKANEMLEELANWR